MTTLPVFETFYSIQGEGYNCGMAAYFIRLAGCNVGCDFCDEKQAWQKNNSTNRTIDSIIEEIKTANAQNVIITGGEPTIYDLNDLTEALNNIGTRTFLETSGVNEITGCWNWITLSPKKYKKTLYSCLQKADEIKIVVEKQDDFLFAENILHLYNTAKEPDNSQLHCYLQPEYSQIHTILPLIIDYIKLNPVWHLSLQTHKMLNIK